MSESTVVGQLSLELGISTDSLAEQLRSASGTAERTLTRNFSGIGKKIGKLLGAAALVGFTKSCINLGSDLAEVQNVVDTTFSSMADKVNQFASAAQTQFGLSETVAKQYMGTLGAMSTSMGFTEKQAYEMSEAIAGLSGDVASFYNMTSDEAFTKLKSIWTGETESLKEIGVLLTQTNLDQYALNNGFGKTTAQMTEQEKVMLRYQYTMSALSKAQGDFAKTSDSWANQTRILSLQFDSLKATLGQGLINVFTPILKAINGLISKLQTLAEKFKSFTEALFGKSETTSVLQEVASSATDVSSGIDGITSSAKKAQRMLAGFDKITKLDSGTSSDSTGTTGTASGGTTTQGTASLEEATKSQSVIEKMIDRLKDKLNGFTGWLNKNFSKSVSEAIPKVLSVFEGGFRNIKDVWNDCSTLGEPIKKVLNEDFPLWINAFITTSANQFNLWGTTANTIFSDVWNGSIYPILEGLITMGLPFIYQFSTEWINTSSTLLTEINDIFNMIWEDAISPIVGKLTGFVLEVGGILSEAWNEHGAAIFEKIRKAIETISDIVKNIWNTVLKPIIDLVCKAVEKLWNDHLKGVVETVIDSIVNIAHYLLDFWNNTLAPLINFLVDTLGPIFTKIFGGILGVVTECIGGAIDAIGDIFSALEGIVQFITGVFSGNWKQAWEGVKKIFSGIWNALVNVIKAPLNLLIGFINTILSGIATAVNAVIKALNKLSFTVPDWVPGIGGKKFGFDIDLITALQIPKLAQGGYVKANTPQLAMIGDNKYQGEVVAPEGKLAKLLDEAIARGGTGFDAEILRILKEILRLLESLDLNIVIDGKKLKDIIVSKINENTMSTGVCEIIT